MILDAAMSEFAEQGYEGSTTASIARRVGVTQPLVHYHFGSKEALWRATVDLLFEKLHLHLNSMGDGVDNANSAPGLVELTFGFMDFAVANPEFARVLNHEGVVEGPRLRWLSDHYLRPLFERWGVYLDELKAVAAGEGAVRNRRAQPRSLARIYKRTPRDHADRRDQAVRRRRLTRTTQTKSLASSPARRDAWPAGAKARIETRSIRSPPALRLR
jgi:AcrR family transcriptional regulator